MWWMWLATAGAGPFSFGEGPQVFGTQPQEVEDQAEQGPVKILMTGRDGDTLKVDGWPFGTLPVETELAGGLHKFRVEGAAGLVEIEAVVIVKADEVVEIDLAAALAPVEAVGPASIQGNKPELASPTEAATAASEATAEVAAEVATEPAKPDSVSDQAP